MRKIDTKAFKKAMIDKDINTIGELEEKSGVSRCTIAEVMNGARTPSYETIARLADTLELDSEDVGRIFYA